MLLVSANASDRERRWETNTDCSLQDRRRAHDIILDLFKAVACGKDTLTQRQTADVVIAVVRAGARENFNRTVDQVFVVVLAQLTLFGGFHLVRHVAKVPPGVVKGFEEELARYAAEI